MYNFDHIELLRRKSPKANFASDMFSVDTENVPVSNSLSSPSSEHVSSLGIANVAIVSLEPKTMGRIMACIITHFGLSTKYLTSKKTKNKEEESKKEIVCSSPVMLTARIWNSFSYKALFVSCGSSACLKFRSHS